MNLSSKTACVIDYGLFTPFAEKLAESFGKVLYYMPNARSKFSRANLAYVGQGLPGVERIHDLWDYVDAVDCFVFPDVNDGSLQEYLRNQGHRVWGLGKAESYERDRWKFRQWQHKVGMDIPKTTHVVGMDDLRDELQKQVGPCYVKLSEFRGETETFRVDGYDLASPKLDELEHELGAAKDDVEFIIEEPIEAVAETGFDGFVCDGKILPVGGWGYEVKDKSYCGKATAYNAAPQRIRKTTDALLPLLANSRGCFSTEVRVGKNGKNYLIDPTFRLGSPPHESQMELYSNWGDIVWGVSGGEPVTPTPVAPYVAWAAMESEFARDCWMPIEIPDDARQWVKLHNHAIIDGIDYAVPLGDKQGDVGAVVGVGKTMAEAIASVKKRSDTVKGYKLVVHGDSLDDGMKVIESGRNVGLDF